MVVVGDAHLLIVNIDKAVVHPESGHSALVTGWVIAAAHCLVLSQLVLMVREHLQTDSCYHSANHANWYLHLTSLGCGVLGTCVKLSAGCTD